MEGTNKSKLAQTPYLTMLMLKSCSLNSLNNNGEAQVYMYAKTPSPMCRFHLSSNLSSLIQEKEKNLIT